MAGFIDESDVKLFIDLCERLKNELCDANCKIPIQAVEKSLSDLQTYRSEIWRNLLIERLKGVISGNKMDKLYLNPLQEAYHAAVLAVQGYKDKQKSKEQLYIYVVHESAFIA